MPKKNFRKVPKWIKAKLRSYSKNEFIVAAVLRLPRQESGSEMLAKLGINNHSDIATQLPKTVPVDARSGNYSQVNKYGKEIVRKDLPMLTKTYSHESPNFGDWQKGSHTVSWDRDIYVRENVGPRNYNFAVEKVGEYGDGIVLAAKVDTVLDSNKANFGDDLLFGLNLLQENFGICDVFEAGEEFKERNAYMKLGWEVFPPGRWRDPSHVEKLVSHLGEKRANEFLERLDIINKFNPIQSYIGSSFLGNRLYYVFIFPNTVVAECPLFGNALYYLPKNMVGKWKDIYSASKRLAIRGGAKRLMHLG